MNQTVGFIGLGKMGMPMARNLLNNGYHVIGTDVHDCAKVEFESYGGTSGKIIDWIHNVQNIILMLPSSTIVNQIIDEINEHYDPTQHTQQEPLTIIDMSSSYPSETRKNESKLQEKNIKIIDAPVSGGVKKAISATLTIMVGGNPETFANCKRLLESMGNNIFHVGPIGSGHLIKAINNFLSATHLLASCEAVQLLEEFEVDPATAVNVFNQSTGRSGSTEYKFPAFILSESYDSGFSLDLLKKDVQMATQLFLDSKADTSLPGLVFDRFNEASTTLSKEADHTEIYQYVSSYLLLQRGKTNEKDEKNSNVRADSSISF